MLSVPQNLSLKYQQKPPKEPKIKNKGTVKAECGASLVAMPVAVASLGIKNGMKKVSEISAEDSAQLIKSARKGLKNSGLYEKGASIYRMKEVSTKEVYPAAKKVIENLCTGNFEGIFGDIKALHKSLNYGKKDYKVINAFLNESKKQQENSLLFKLFSKNKNIKTADNLKFNELGQNLGKEIGKFIGKIITLPYKFGENACCLTETKKIIIPDKHLQTSVFHEMGHALNANGILKGFQKCRPLASILPAFILFAALENKRKVNDETQSDDSKLQKGKDFVKRNAGKLTFLSMMPMVAEEGIASLRGQKIAKNLVKSGDLSKNLFSKVKLTNIGGFSTYMLGAVAATATVKAAIHIKDKAQAKYEAKQMAKYEAKLQKWEAKQNRLNIR